MGLIKGCLIMIAICLYIMLAVDISKIYKVLNNSIGKKVEDIIPQFNKFINKDIIYIILASVISFIVIVFL